jgi:iron complex transport system permease protein
MVYSWAQSSLLAEAIGLSKGKSKVFLPLKNTNEHHEKAKSHQYNMVTLQHVLKFGLVVVLPLLGVLLALYIGRYPISASAVTQEISSQMKRLFQYIFFGKPFDAMTLTGGIIFKLRLPRALLGFVVGGALAVSGAVLQGIFRNPLVDSGMLGVSNGASFGAVIGFIFFKGDYRVVMTLAFCFGLLAVFLSYMIASIYRQTATIMLVLGGVIVSSVFSSLVSLGKYVADPYNQLPGIIFWLMGSLASADYPELLTATIPITLGTGVIYLMRWRINILSLGDLEAFSLGINIRRSKLILIASSALITAAAVSVSGTIGWIGLIIPHMIRMMFGADNRLLIPFSFLMGGSFLVIVDILARNISSAEMPIGILTALIGAPFYVMLLRRTKGRDW